MCLQAGLSIAFIMVGGGFRSLINFAVVASWAFYFLTVRAMATVIRDTGSQYMCRFWA